VAGLIPFSRGGVYLARLDLAQGAEVGILRPVVILTDQQLLESQPAHVFVCPLSSWSNPDYETLHLALPARDSLRVKSYALVEHCRAISIRRLQHDRLAQLNRDELVEIIRRLNRLVGW